MASPVTCLWYPLGYNIFISDLLPLQNPPLSIYLGAFFPYLLTNIGLTKSKILKKERWTSIWTFYCILKSLYKEILTCYISFFLHPTHNWNCPLKDSQWQCHFTHPDLCTPLQKASESLVRGSGRYPSPSQKCCLGKAMVTLPSHLPPHCRLHGIWRGKIRTTSSEKQLNTPPFLNHRLSTCNLQQS